MRIFKHEVIKNSEAVASRAEVFGNCPKTHPTCEAVRSAKGRLSRKKCCYAFPLCYNVFMALFNNNSKNTKHNNARKGACFSITMPYSVEKRLKEIQASMGLNSKSQTVVFLIHHYDREQHAFDSIDKLSQMVDKMEKLAQNNNAFLPIESEIKYNKDN